MKLGMVRHAGKSALVVEQDGAPVLLDALYAAAGRDDAPRTMNDLIEGGEALLAQLRGLLSEVRAEPLDSETVDWMPPQPRPSKVIGVAFNNMGIRKAAHRDSGVPNFFFKAPSSLTGHGKPIIMEEHFGETIPELELAVVLGKQCRKVTAEEAQEAIFGYTIVNDITSHGLKFGLDSIATTREPELLREHHTAWRNRRDENDNDVYFVYHARSKATDTFGPCGPWITTRDEIADPDKLEVKGWLDGEMFAVDSTASYRFSVIEVIVEASRYFTLEPGDIICMGTSAKGVGNFPNGHRSVNIHKLKGTIEVEIEGLGRLANPVVHTWNS